MTGAIDLAQMAGLSETPAILPEVPATPTLVIAGLEPPTQPSAAEALPAEMERLEKEIAKLEELMMDPELFTREPIKFKKATEALVERQQKLAAAEEEWLELEEKAGG